MSKIICDVCGTAYPETATQCPICSSVRPGGVDAVPVRDETADGHTQGTYTYVKGGRFSKKNVKKRNRERMESGQAAPYAGESDEYEDEKNNTGLIVTAVILALAVIAAVIYILSQFFGTGAGKTDGTVPPVQGTAQSTEQTADTTEPSVLRIPCEDLVISKKNLEFEKQGVAYLLNVTTMPKDTTDEIVFTSSDESVATVSVGGKITAVGGGEAVITITCGDKVTQCEVLCNFEGGQEETTEPTNEVNAATELKLNRDDFTMSVKGDTWKLYSGDIAADKITWTSDDESVATIKEGVVTAVGKGMTKVYGEYGGNKVSCIVRCADSVGVPDTEDNTQNNDTQNSVNTGNYSISSNDVTISVGEQFTLTLKDKDGVNVDVTWSVTDSKVCSVSGNSITGAALGTVIVSTEIDGVSYECIVRVSE